MCLHGKDSSIANMSIYLYKFNRVTQYDNMYTIYIYMRSVSKSFSLFGRSTYIDILFCHDDKILEPSKRISCG